MNRPAAVAFDVVETLFSLDAPRPRFTAAGRPEQRLEEWFASFPRDAFALEISGVYRPFREVASAALAAMQEQERGSSDMEKADHAIDGFAERDAHDDVAPALAALREAGTRIVALTSGSAKVTSALPVMEAPDVHGKTLGEVVAGLTGAA